MSDYLSFRKMITPVFIQAIFWIAVVVIVIAGLVTMASDTGGFFQGLLIIVLGPLVARIYAEIFLVLFRINDNVRLIADRNGPPAAGAPAMTPSGEATI